MHRTLVSIGRVAQFLNVLDGLQGHGGIAIGGMLDGYFQFGVFLSLDFLDPGGLHAVLLELGEWLPASMAVVSLVRTYLK